MNKSVSIAFGLLGIMIVAAFAPEPASAETLSWRIDGQMRQAIVYPPSSPAARGKPPLVMAFHGYGDDAQNFQYVNLHKAWPEAVVVYLQGLPTRGSLPGWQVERGQYDDRDLKLVDTSLAALRKRFNIDDTRIYATGFSNGAMFSYLLWAERPQVFAAFAPVAGRLRPSVSPTERRPLLHIAGSRDSTVPFEDQKAAFETAIRVNAVGAEKRACGAGCTLYGAGTPAPVMVWIHGGAHTFPPGTSERIVAFLRATGDSARAGELLP